MFFELIYILRCIDFISIFLGMLLSKEGGDLCFSVRCINYVNRLYELYRDIIVHNGYLLENLLIIRID